MKSTVAPYAQTKKILWFVAFFLWLVLVFATGEANGQSIPYTPQRASAPVAVLDNLGSFTVSGAHDPVRPGEMYKSDQYNFLLGYVGRGNDISGDPKCVAIFPLKPYKVIVWATRSVTALPPPPWDTIGDYVETFEIDRLDIGSGFIVIPAKKRYLCINGNCKIEDKDLYLVIHITSIPGCLAPPCVMKLLTRTKLSTLPKVEFEVPTIIRRRGVVR